ncbi:MAG: hypothetical protein ABEJ28_00155 [Salinigranum sp.]
MNGDTDRPRGILTRADREYLLGEAVMTHEQSRRNAEARIRERVVNAVLDFTLLVHALKRKDRRQIFEKSVDDPAFVDGAMAMLAFAYAGLEESGVAFESVLEPAIRRAEEARAADVGSAVDVTVDFDVETRVRTDLDDVEARIGDGRPVTPRELFALVVAADGSLDAEEVLLRRRPDDEDGFADRIADYLDADLEPMAGGLVRLRRRV